MLKPDSRPRFLKGKPQKHVKDTSCFAENTERWLSKNVIFQAVVFPDMNHYWREWHPLEKSLLHFKLHILHDTRSRPSFSPLLLACSSLSATKTISGKLTRLIQRWLPHPNPPKMYNKCVSIYCISLIHSVNLHIV